MLLVLACIFSIGGIVLVLAGVTEDTALLKFALGMLLLDAGSAMTAAWARRP